MSSKDKRKLAAIMFADVVGYSRMMANNEERTLELLKDFENICSRIISDNDGKIIKKVGDELFCEFSSAKQAVDCALTIQKSIQPYNDSRPKDFKLEIRIGIHVGDIVLRDGDVFGDGVNVASRIQPFANPGGICISNAVKEAISSHPNYNIISEGQQELKNIIEKHSLYRVETGFESIEKNKGSNKFNIYQYKKWAYRILLLFIGLYFLKFLFLETLIFFDTNIKIGDSVYGSYKVERIDPKFERATFLGEIRNFAISPNGNYFAYDTGPYTDVFLQDINNIDNPLKLFTPKPKDWIAKIAWTPDGNKIKLSGRFDEGYKTYLIPKFGGAIQKQTYHITASPNGKLGIHAEDNSKSIYIINLVDDEIVDTINIIDDFTWFYDIKWSPKNDILLYTTILDGRYSIWTMSTTKKERNLLIETSIISRPIWSPSSDAIYYLKYNHNNSDLIKINIDSVSGVKVGHERKIKKILMRLSGLLDWWLYEHLSISQTGKLMFLKGDYSYSNLFAATPISIEDSTFLQTNQLTKGTHKISGYSISPNESQIAYSLEYAGNSNIYTMPINGGEKTQITWFDSSYCKNPAWSPNGKEIAFININNNEHTIWKTNLATGQQTLFKEASNLSGVLFDLRWSPSEKIIYHKEGHINFCIIDPVTGLQTDLMKNDSLGWPFWPRFSPNMEKLLIWWNHRNHNDGDGLWMIPYKDSLVENRAEFLSKNYIPVGWLNNNKFISTNRGKIFIHMVDGSLIDSIYLPSLTGGIEVVSKEKSYILKIDNEKNFDLWYLTNFE